ncbi:family 2 glycosyl transferase [Litorilituus sediminis]|uniref:Family 2 glycosyl transferase n=1 Tax=Litorilituus sediminis TaxID=718192 RepID=A0A4P6P9Q7_9GAMM|nr:family 2 glycosyl transferase [Litorilituus sediminis]QBG37019.1 family 2 glycosyl transferase [Litorilituus sediminis]
MSSQQHWSKVKERGSMLGIETLVFVYKVFGKGFFKVCLTPVMFYFYLTGREARHATWYYLANYNASQGLAKLNGLAKFNQGFKVFFSFGLSIVDKFDAWLGKVNIDDIDIVNQAAYQELLEAQGSVIFSAHLGNMEVCRAIFSSGDNKRPLNVITYNEHTPSFNNFLKKVNAESAVNFVHINNFGPDDTIKLKQKIEDGESVVIFADRTSVNNPNSVNFAPFLGEQAPFAVGPFALASIMECKVFTMFCINENGKYRTYIDKLADPIKVKRKERQAYFKDLTERFAKCLEKHVKLAPYQWYNFFNFWHTVKKPEPQGNEE